MAPEFLRVGERRIRLADVDAVEARPDGSVVLEAGEPHQVLTGDEAQALLAWVDAHVVNAPKAPEPIPAPAPAPAPQTTPVPAAAPAPRSHHKAKE